MREIFNLIINNLDVILLSLISLILTFVKTSKSSLSKKLTSLLSRLDDIYVRVGDKEYALKNLTIYKK